MSISQSITRDVIFTDLKIGSLQKDQVLWYYSCGYIAYKKTTAVKYFEIKKYVALVTIIEGIFTQEEYS